MSRSKKPKQSPLDSNCHFRVAHELVLPLSRARGAIVHFDIVNGEPCNFREANAEELIEILNVYKRMLRNET